MAVAPLAAAMGLALAPAQGLAQTAAAAATTAGSASVSEVVVTGSILHHQNVDSISPLQVVTADSLEKRGLTTLDSAIQNLSGNNSGALPNSFTANGAFAAGASGASLRGLTTNSTLVLFDGLRAAYYPLADDGTRNFVDLNTIPDVMVDRVEVLQDGASSTYGADAIAGVVNIITKKQYQGLTVTGEGGIGQYGGGAESRFSALAGYGDLNRDGYNVFIGVEYEHDGLIRNRDRGYPYNSADLSKICGTSLNGGQTCELNSVVNGLQFDNSFNGIGSNIVAMVRPLDAMTGAPLANWQILNTAAGCGKLTPITITAAEVANTGATGVTGATLCQQDNIHDYGIITPRDDRFSISGRVTKTVGANAQAYAEVNYYQNTVFVPNAPSSVRQQTTPGALGTTFSTTNLALPVFVCASGINCDATNGTLNPNNPFAAAGQLAQIRVRLSDIPSSTEDFSQVYRIAAGLNGTFGGDWHYDIGGTFSESDLRVTQTGEIYVQHLLDVVANGSYNFVDPSQNSQAVRDFVAPTSVQYSNSQLAQLQATITKDLYTLPGGPLQLGVGAAVRYEEVTNPTANGDENGPTERYFTINPFGTIGSRNVESAYFELDAPIVKQFDIDVSGRYDRYSTGQSNFSPKVAAKFKPFNDIITFRGTYSKGFRIPSFAESNSLPTTGFITLNAPLAFQQLHNNNGYGQNYSLGLTTVGTAGLKPEKSTNFTAGIVFQPIKQLSFSADYYHIKKTDVIAPGNYNLALAAYFAGTPIPPGYQVIPGLADPNLPNAMVLPGFIKYGFANQNSLLADGFDFAATANVSLPWGVTWTSLVQATYVNRFQVTFADGTTQSYAGTLGPYQTTSASGTPKWRANWENTFAFGKATLSATAYYTSGYSQTAEDVTGPGTAFQCAADAAATGVPTTYVDGVTPVVCNVHHFIDVDAHATYQATEHVQVYLDVSNVFNTRPPFDPTTYGGYQYNPAWANAGIVGRFFKIGAKATF
ncbi:MAG: TonB-dependent receptor [Caulobacteraceae bacterium]